MADTKIDLKDRKILYELDLNCRQSNSQIGKKVGLTRDVVAYRIKRMEDEGVIKGYWTAINTFKLGYNVFRIYINFQYVSTEKRKEIIQHFVNYKNAWAVISIKGEIDFDAIIWINDMYEFYQFWSSTLDKFEYYFARYTFSTYIEAFNYVSSYLLDKTPKGDRLHYRTTCGGGSIEIDELDYKILNEIAINARILLVELAEKVGCTSQTVLYRMKNLEENDVIKAFRVNIDLAIFGLSKYKLEIYLRDHNHRNAIWDYLKTTSHCDTLDITVGWCDLEFEMIVENMDRLSQIMEDLQNRFPDAIKKQTFWIIGEYHKERWLPELF